jgi:hypothetical protein
LPEPSVKMSDRWQPVGFLFVAGGVREDKIVAEINRVAGPRNKMIHLPGLLPERPVTIEALARLARAHNGPHHRQIGAFTAEQELVQVGLLGQPVGIVVPHKLQPCTPDQIADQRVVFPKAEAYACLKGDAGAGADLVVEKIELLRADGLQLPERHFTDLGGDLRHRPLPRLLVAPQASQRTPAGPAHVLQQRDDFWRFASVLLQQTGIHTTSREIRRALPPIIFGKFFTNAARWDFQRRIVVAPQFHAQIGQREQERVFVGGDERAFRQQALEVAQELDLLLRAGHDSLPIDRLAGNDPADAAAWIGGIALPARNDMDMRVGHRLTGGNSVIHTDVEGVRVIFVGEQLADNGDLQPERREFIRGQVKNGCHVPLGNHQRMALVHREAIEEGKRPVGFEKDAFLGQLAKGTRRLAHGAGVYAAGRVKTSHDMAGSARRRTG